MRNTHYYPANWKNISDLCRQRAGWKCEHCGISHGEYRISRKNKVYQVRLQAAHLDHRERHNPNAALVCLCYTCHWWLDFEIWVKEQEERLDRLKRQKCLARIARAREERNIA